MHKGSLHPLDVFSKSHCATEIDYALFVFQGRRGKGAIYTFATGNGGLIGDSCAYNGYVNSIFTIAISGVNQDNSRPSYAEDCAGIMASAYSRDTKKGVGKVVSEVVKSLGYGLLLFFYLKSGPSPYGGPLLKLLQPCVFREQKSFPILQFR